VLVPRAAEAETVVEILDRAGRTGSRTSAMAATALRATARLARGSLDEARAAAEEALEAARTHEMPLFAPHASAVLATVALHQGNLVAARKHLETGAELLPWERSRPWWALTLLTAARLATATTGASAAMDTLRPTLLRDPDLRREVMLEDPAAAGWLVRTAREAGAYEMADAAVATSESLIADNPAFPSLRGSALHARGLLVRDAELLRRARSQFSDPMSKANAAEDLGAILVDADRAAAIDYLDEAHAQYGALGAAWHTARVNRALRNLGVRRRSWKYAKRPLTGWESLTATERKVADLVAEGLTNKQAASHLFVSSHTVGFHLRQIYRKLDVRSRTELVRCKPRLCR
jgi:ATP/maltotriose-dependent transcriptional regulator MalT